MVRFLAVAQTLILEVAWRRQALKTMAARSLPVREAASARLLSSGSTTERSSEPSSAITASVRTTTVLNVQSERRRCTARQHSLSKVWKEPKPTAICSYSGRRQSSTASRMWQVGIGQCTGPFTSTWNARSGQHVASDSDPASLCGCVCRAFRQKSSSRLTGSPGCPGTTPRHWRPMNAALRSDRRTSTFTPASLHLTVPPPVGVHPPARD